MKVAIMQPYLLPYLGYFQLIAAVDHFVLYDDVAYIKGGWINRNRYLSEAGAQLFTVPVQAASSNRAINQLELAGCPDWRRKLKLTFRQHYAKAPCFDSTMPVIEEIIDCGETNLAAYVSNSIRRICVFIGIDTPLTLSSKLKRDASESGADRVISIVKSLQGDTYINSAGGTHLYSPETFRAHGLSLKFLRPSPGITYSQFGNPFVPWLSIADVFMFNPATKIMEMLAMYELMEGVS